MTTNEPQQVNTKDVVDQLIALWNPSRNITPSADTDSYAEDEDDDSCTGSGGCGCSSCYHDESVRTARCSITTCTAPTQFRLRTWRLTGGRQVQAREIGRTENPDEWLRFGDAQSFMIGSERYACGKPHAYELWQQLLQRYNKPTDDEAQRWRVEIENWRYEPDELDLPHADLVWLRALAITLKHDVQGIIDTVNPHAAHPTRDASYALSCARRTAARVVAQLADLDTRAIPQTRYTDAIPADVHTVTTQPAGQQPHYFNRRFPESPTSGWFSHSLGPGGVVYASDAELLAAYPDGLYERPRSELLWPGRVEGEHHDSEVHG